MAILFIDVLDDFFTPLMLEINVDVGRLAAFTADEALEQQVAFNRVDCSYLQAIADRRIGGRAATLTQNAPASRKAHDVMHGDEEHFIFKFFDQGQLKC